MVEKAERRQREGREKAESRQREGCPRRVREREKKREKERQSGTQGKERARERESVVDVDTKERESIVHKAASDASDEEALSHVMPYPETVYQKVFQL